MRTTLRRRRGSVCLLANIGASAMATVQRPRPGAPSTTGLRSGSRSPAHAKRRRRPRSRPAVEPASSRIAQPEGGAVERFQLGTRRRSADLFQRELQRVRLFRRSPVQLGAQRRRQTAEGIERLAIAASKKPIATSARTGREGKGSSDGSSWWTAGDQTKEESGRSDARSRRLLRQHSSAIARSHPPRCRARRSATPIRIGARAARPRHRARAR